MTTQRDFEQMPTFTITELTPVSSDPNEDFLHPVLEMFRPALQLEVVKEPRLYLVPSTFGEEFDAEFAPQPTSAATLPEITPLINQFIHNVLEIWAGRRSSQQLQLSCHYSIFSQLQRATGSLTENGRVRKTRITEPLDGICEATVTVRFGDRLRVVAIRFEGLDGRWLCTCLTLI
jgi:hypothetical protein